MMNYVIDCKIKPEDIYTVEEVKQATRDKIWLDLDNWGVIDIMDKAGDIVLVMTRITLPKPTDPYRYCIQYRGGGRYFQTMADLTEYACKKFGEKWWFSNCIWS